MLDNLESIVIIISTIIITSFATINSFNSLQKKLRENIDKALDKRDTKLKLWFKDFFEDYYIPLDDRIKNLNSRIKVLEKK